MYGKYVQSLLICLRIEQIYVYIHIYNKILKNTDHIALIGFNPTLF